MARSRRDDDDDDDDRPRRRSRRDDDDDDDDDDDTPRRKRRSIADDDDDDDRPRKRRVAKKRAKTGGPLLLILGGIGGLVLMIGAGVAVFFLFFNENPKSAFEDLQNAAVAKNYGRVYDRFDTNAQKFFDGVAGFAKLDPALASHKGKKGRELFIAVCEENDRKNAQSGKSDDFFDRWKRKATVESVTETGDKAVLTIKDADGKTQTLHMKKQDGKWRLSLGAGVGP